MTENNEEIDSVDTDWIANSYLGYGFGYTKEQALQAMAANVKPSSESVTVYLVEHIGNATMSMSGVDVDTFVSGEVIEVDPEDFQILREKAIEASNEAERITDDPDNLVEELEE